MKPASSRRARHAGFTLLELIVVIAIFGVFAMMAYGGLDSVLKTRHEVEIAMDRTAELQKAYMKLRNDFQQLRNRPARDGYGEAQPALRSTQDGIVEFTRGGWRNPLSQPRSSLERVAYRLDGHELKRSSWRVLDQAQDSRAVELVIADRVNEVKWRFLDAQREWHPDWPPTSTAPSAAPGATTVVAVPLAAELTIETKDWGQLVYLFRLGVEPAPAQQAAAGGTPPPPPPPPAGDKE